jgi:hypothetical protein
LFILKLILWQEEVIIIKLVAQEGVPAIKAARGSGRQPIVENLIMANKQEERLRCQNRKPGTRIRTEIKVRKMMENK